MDMQDLETVNRTIDNFVNDINDLKDKEYKFKKKILDCFTVEELQQYIQNNEINNK